MKRNVSVFTDRELTDRFNAGSKKAFAEIYEQYWGPLYLHAYRLLKDEEQAKDAVQDVFTYILEKQGQYIGQSISITLFTKTRNHIISLIRKEKTRKNYLEHHFDWQVLDKPADEQMREKEMAEIIEREIRALPPKMRAVFEASRKKYMSYQEIAKQEGKSVETVRRQISDSLNILKTKLGSFLLLQIMSFILWYYR